MNLTHENLPGRWIVVGSEIDRMEGGDEVHHFTTPDRFDWELEKTRGRITRLKNRDLLTDDGFSFGPEGKINSSVTAWLESGFLIFRPEHAMATWSSPLTIGISNPSFLESE